MIEQYISHNGENLWDFEVVACPDVENINHIHPLKQKDVGYFVESVKKEPHILGVIVFGSAVRFDCHSGSDLDLLVIRDDEELRMEGSLDQIKSELDLVLSFRLGERLKKEIARTGVVVYRRGEHV